MAGGDVMSPDRRIEVRTYSMARRLVLGSVRAGRRAAPMHGVLTVDVTDLRARLARSDRPVSFTATVLAAVGRAAAAHPEIHAYRDWRGRLVSHRYVDATVMVEVPSPGGPVALARLVRDVERRTVADLTGELRVTQAGGGAPPGGRSRILGYLARVPGLVSVLYYGLGRTSRGRHESGTVLVTAVGMFGGGAGFAIAPVGLHSLTVVVGAMAPRPWVIEGDVAVRDLLELTVSVDHRVVDGAPAARFAAELRRLLETGAALDDPA